MRANRLSTRSATSTLLLGGLLLLSGCGSNAPAKVVNTDAQIAAQAQSILIGFNGSSNQFPYSDQYYTAQTAYFQSIGKTAPTGRRCHAYLSWDIANQPVGSGPAGTEGSRAWFEAWLASAQTHCDEALVTFKNIPSVTTPAVAPAISAYESAMVTFLGTSWTYTGFTGTIVYTAWNEPNGSGNAADGLSAQLTPQQAADYYLALRKHCTGSCKVAAGDFGSNGQEYLDYPQNCADDTQTPCSNASYMDQYKYYLVADAATFGFTSSFRPEIFAYHGWDDVNDYINDTAPANQCDGDVRCTMRALLGALNDSTWSKTEIWDTEVAAGQNPESNPTPTMQACAASFLMQLSAGLSNRVTRIYYTQPDEADGLYWSLFDSTGAIKPAFTVLAAHSTTYEPTATGAAICP